MLEFEISDSLKLTEEQKQRYIDSFGMACPFCGLTEQQANKFMEYGRLELEDEHYKKVTCGNCGKSWYEVYAFSRSEAVKHCPLE